MTPPSLLYNIVGTLIAACAWFLFGFVQAGTSAAAAQTGILIGIVSATAWVTRATASFSGWATNPAEMTLGFLDLLKTPAGGLTA